MRQQLFSAVDYTFAWDGDWYTFDEKAGALAARKARDVAAKEAKAQGFAVRKFSLGQQLITRGGIGTTHPHIEVLSACYGLNID